MWKCQKCGELQRITFRCKKCGFKFPGIDVVAQRKMRKVKKYPKPHGRFN